MPVLLFGVAAVVAVPAFGLAVLVSVGFGAGVFTAAAFGCLAASAPTGHLRLTGSAGNPAEPVYFTGPALRDHWRLTTVAMTAVHRRIRTGANGSLTRWLWLHRPVRGAWRVPASAAGLGVTVGFLVVSAFAVAVVLVQWVVLVAVVGTLRLTVAACWLLESGMLAVHHITTECGTCHQHMARPVFSCACGRHHRDLMPGRWGVYHRTCLCGRRLPTLLARGKRNLDAHCGHCDARLPGPVQSVPMFHLPVVGGVSAGTTVFTHSATASLCDRPLFRPADDVTARRLALDWRFLRVGILPPRTPCGQPTAYTIHREGHCLLQLHDAAGEVMECGEGLAAATFLKLSDGIVFVIDPFTLPEIRTRADPDVLRTVRPGDTDPKAVLDGLVQTLREHATRHPPVAVVVTKTDALAVHPYTAAPTDRTASSTAIRDWLIAQNRPDIVNTLDRHFPRVGYFATGDPTTHDPAAPIMWLLEGCPP